MVPHNLPSTYPSFGGNSLASMNGKGQAEAFAINTAKRRSLEPAFENDERLRDLFCACERRQGAQNPVQREGPTKNAFPFPEIVVQVGGDVLRESKVWENIPVE